MADEVKLPRLGQGMESGRIVRWLKAEGEMVHKGQPLFEVDTEKATQEVEAEASGMLISIMVEAGEVPVGETVALIGEPGEVPAKPEAEPPAPADGAAADKPSGGSDFRSSISGARESVGVKAPDEVKAPGEAEAPVRAKASPLARRMARERGLELGELTGTGPDGRIIAEDIERAGAGAAAEVPPAEAPPAEKETPRVKPTMTAVPTPPARPEDDEGDDDSADEAGVGEIESIPLSRVRKTIARRLTQAWTVPAFQLTVSVEMTHANELIARSRELNPGVKVTVTDLIAKVCSRALMRHPEVNAQFTDEAILRLPSANIGLAVAAPQGLLVPVIHAAERLTLVELAHRRAELVGRVMEGGLQLADLDGGTFTISNLGMFGIEQFLAVLNPPQAAILAVGATVDRVVAVEGEIVIRPMMTITLTVDHRAVDGAPAADFLRTVKTFLEDPALAL